MKPIITTNMQKDGNNEYMLVSIKGGEGAIGFKSVITEEYKRVKSTCVFHIGNEPLITVIEQKGASETANKLMFQCGSRDKCDDKLVNKITAASENFYLYSQSFGKALQGIFELMDDGLYVVHTAKMNQSDGSGNYFWNAYTTRHEYRGSEDINPTIGEKRNFSPCFLVPTLSPSNYTENKVKLNTEKIKAKKNFGGIAFHLTGMFCALLDGHHAATAALLNNVDFECVVIEPVRRLMYSEITEDEPHGRAIAFSCPYTKLYLDSIPMPVMESFLLRRQFKPDKYYFDVRQKCGKFLSVRLRNLLPKELNTKVEQIPDIEMMESAYAVEVLTDDMLKALLQGKTELDGKVIISENYYSSIVTACNYLQYADFDKFVNFALSIVYNADLSALHQYVITRIKTVMNPKIRDFFADVQDNNPPLYKAYVQTANAYIKDYELAEVQRIEQQAAAAIAKLSGELDDDRKNDAQKKRLESFTEKLNEAEQQITKDVEQFDSVKEHRKSREE